MLHTILYHPTVSSSRSEPLAVFTIRVSTVSVTISVPYHGLLQFSRYGFLLYLFQYQYRIMVRVAVDSYCRQCRCDVGTCRSPLALLPPLPRGLAATHAALTRHRRWCPSRLVHTGRSGLTPPGRAWRASPTSSQCSAPSVPLWSSVSCGSVRGVCFHSLPGSPFPPLCPLLAVPH